MKQVDVVLYTEYYLVLLQYYKYKYPTHTLQ